MALRAALALAESGDIKLTPFPELVSRLQQHHTVSCSHSSLLSLTVSFLRLACKMAGMHILDHLGDIHLRLCRSSIWKNQTEESLLHSRGWSNDAGGSRRQRKQRSSKRRLRGTAGTCRMRRRLIVTAIEALL